MITDLIRCDTCGGSGEEVLLGIGYGRRGTYRHSSRCDVCYGAGMLSAQEIAQEFHCLDDVPHDEAVRRITAQYSITDEELNQILKDWSE